MKNGGMIHKNPRNETSEGEKPDSYVSYDEVISAQLSEQDASLVSTPNMDSGHGIKGGPAAGEPNPAGMKPTC